MLQSFGYSKFPLSTAELNYGPILLRVGLSDVSINSSWIELIPFLAYSYLETDSQV